MIQAQDTQSEVFPGPLLAPLIKITVAALPCQEVGRQQQGVHRQPVLSLNQDGSDDFRQRGGLLAGRRVKGQMRQYPGRDDIFGQDFHKGGKGDGLHLDFHSAVGVVCI